jgi:zinc transport system substrate-binding protein
MTSRKQRLFFVIIFMVFLLAVIPGCTGHPAQSSDKGGKMTVAVSIVPQKTFVETICGDHVNVITMIPPGFSPENYEPTPKDAQMLDDAAVYFSIGVPAEAASILPRIRDQKVVDLAAEVAQKYPDLELEKGERDPHTWLSPKRVKVMAEVIAREMSALDPTNADEYLVNMDNFLSELDQLDTEIKARFEGLTMRSFFIFHPSCGYLAADYGLKMYALEQHGKEATPQHLQELIDLAGAEHVRTVFAQKEIDSRQLAAFAEETGCAIVLLDPLSADYLANMQAMTKAIAGAMQNG